MTLAEIANDYIRRFREIAISELRFYELQPTLHAAIRVAGLSRTEDGKRHSHQCRIPGHVLEAGERRLQVVSQHLKKATSFSDLHREVDDEIRAIRGIGDLAVYDIAHRIGAYLGHEPEAVYVHAGTRKGARALGLKGDVIPLDQIPRALRRLSPAEIEDCLCIYKDRLRGTTSPLSKRYWCGPVRVRAC